MGRYDRDQDRERRDGYVRYPLPPPLAAKTYSPGPSVRVVCVLCSCTCVVFELWRAALAVVAVLACVVLPVCVLCMKYLVFSIVLVLMPVLCWC